jgi:hypothetical protein
MPDTIAAIATGAVRSAIGVLRLSGDEAIKIASSVFRAYSGKPLHEYKSRRLVYGARRTPTRARTPRNSTATAPPRSSRRGLRPCLRPARDRLSRASLQSARF